MPKKSIFTNKEEAFLRELVKNKVPFMIVGLSAAALQGAPVVTQDVDLWFHHLNHPGIRRALKKVGGTYIPPFGLNPPMFAGKHLEMFDIVINMDGLKGFQKEAAGALRIPMGVVKVNVLPLERIIKSKEALLREKDRLVLPILKDVLVTLQSKK